MEFRLSEEKKNVLKRKLDLHYSRYDKSMLSPDPLEIPHKFYSREDIELVAFVSSVFAYGNVKLILRVLYKITDILGDNPSEAIKREGEIEEKIRKSKIMYRFYSNEDVINLFRLLSRFLSEYGSLEDLFARGYEKSNKNVYPAIDTFSLSFLKECDEADCLTPGIKFMFSLPSKGSAAKRMNLFLRWMVRKDELDFGLWRRISKNQLVIPLDTHVAKISRAIGLTARKTNGRKTAEEITETLKIFDAEDPVKYDFALCHIGMRKENF